MTGTMIKAGRPFTEIMTMQIGLAPKLRLMAAGAPDYQRVASLFLRILAGIYLAAFWSLAVQITGLAGAQGIYPIGEQLHALAGQYGIWRFLIHPSLFWLWSDDTALLAAAYTGCALSVLLLLGCWQRPLLIALYVLYLSLFHAGHYFTNFQWDYLLLESGFLAIFLPGGSRLVVWLFRWLLFRLRFLSGISKLLSGDPTWSGLTALHFYFETQPIPHLGSWYAHQLPDWLLRLGTGSTLVIEILVPLLMFFPRRWRFLAAWVTILWQVLIILTSNHNFFNLLTIALCLFLFDDRALARVLPAGPRCGHPEGSHLPRLEQGRGEADAPDHRGCRSPEWRRWWPVCSGRTTGSRLLPDPPDRRIAFAAGVAAAIIVPVSLAQGVEMALHSRTLPWVSTWVGWIEQYRAVNRYHVFPTIETERIELQISGSEDGKTWQPYAFRYKPSDLDKTPPFIVPHQPRLDWMMWFVPVSPVFLDGFERFLHRLLEGSRPVTGLLADTPFGGRTPLILRVDVYRYHFTSPQEAAQTGNWWKRDYLGPFDPLPFLRREPTILERSVPRRF